MVDPFNTTEILQELSLAQFASVSDLSDVLSSRSEFPSVDASPSVERSEFHFGIPPAESPKIASVAESGVWNDSSVFPSDRLSTE
jgi:hypothetical protein